MDKDIITTPLTKISLSLGAGAATSTYAVVAKSAATATAAAVPFMPIDFQGWIAAAASCAALIYSLCMLTEWFWKRLWKPLFKRWGWVL